jgi:hypothetical protein
MRRCTKTCSCSPLRDRRRRRQRTHCRARSRYRLGRRRFGPFSQTDITLPTEAMVRSAEGDTKGPEGSRITKANRLRFALRDCASGRRIWDVIARKGPEDSAYLLNALSQPPPVRPFVLVVVLRPSSSAVIRVVGAKLLPLAFTMHPSSILANRLDPQPTRTKDDDDDEDDSDMTLNTYDSAPSEL